MADDREEQKQALAEMQFSWFAGYFQRVFEGRVRDYTPPAPTTPPRPLKPNLKAV